MAYAEFTGELDAPEKGFVPFAGELDKEPGGFVASAKQSVGAVIRGAGQVAADFIPGVSQDNPVKRYGQEVIEANPTAVNSFADMADKPGTAVAEATGNAAGSMAGIVGARALGMGITAAAPLTGPAAPITAAIGQIVAWVGPAAIAALPSFGSIRDKQILNDPQTEESAKAKAVAALGAGTVGLIESKFGPQQWAMAALTKEGRAQLAKKFAETGILKGLGYGAAKGAAVEGAEELVQNPIEQLASFDNPTTPENLKETAFGGAMGAIGGGVLGGGTGVAVNLMPQKTAQDILAAPDIDSAIQAANEVLALPAPGANPGETILATERGTAGTAAQFDMLRRQAEIREAGGGMGRNADITDVQAKPTAIPNDPAALLDRQTGDPLAPMVEDRRIRTEAIDAAQQEAEQRKAAEMEAIPELASEQNAIQAALARAGTLEAPTAMELALQRARGASAPAPAATVEADTPQLPRIVERTPEMVAMPQKLAEQRAAATGGEVVRIQNKSGKFAFTVIPKAADVSNAVEAPGAVPSGVDGRGADVGGSEPAGGLGDGGRGAAAEPERSGGADVAVGRGAGQPAAVEPQATWFGRRGDGYLTEGDAQMAIPSRQRVNPDLRWAVERMPSGKFRLAGYAQEKAPVVAVARRAEPVAAPQSAPESAASGAAGQSLSDAPEKWAAKTAEYAKSIAPSAERVGQVAGYSLLRDTRPDWNQDDDGRILAVDKTGNVVADVFFGRRDDGKLEAAAEVAPAARRQGIASAIYEQIERTRGERLAPAEQQTADARAFWEARRRQAGNAEKPDTAPATPAAPTERERINAMTQAAKERRQAAATAKQERQQAEVEKARGKTGAEPSPAPEAAAQEGKDAEPAQFSLGSTPFYSALQREVAAINAKAQPAQGWLAQINGLVKAGKVKADEVEWTGVAEWLQLQAGKVTKEQISDFLKANGVQVTEVTKAAAPSPRQVGEDYRAAMQRQGASVNEAFKMWDAMLAWASDLPADDALKDRGFDLVMRDGQHTGNEIHDALAGSGGTKYERYTLPGGENYRELLLTLPIADDAKRQRELADIARERDWTPEEKAEFNRIAGAAGKNEYRSAHWDEPNVLAHIRFNERADAEGKRVLFVEEIQSDWAQEGRKRGFANGNKMWVLRDVSDRVLRRMYEHEKDEAHKLAADEGLKVSLEIVDDVQVGVPRAPFVDSTDAWLALALKRITTYAVENGFDRVAFVNGEQSAQRYDLSKQISRVEFRDNSSGGVGLADMDGPPTVGTLRAYDMDGSLVIERHAVQPDGIEEYVGKEVAKRLLEAKPKQARSAGINMRQRELSGLDLKVGGEGMKAFYNKIVPAAANKLLAKLGGGKLGTVDLTTKNTKSFRDSNGMEPLRDKQQPGFDITPQMREKAANGLPLFSLRAQQEDQSLSYEEVEKIVEELTAKWQNRPDIKVLDSMSEAPPAVLKTYLEQRSQGAAGRIHGFHLKGTVYLVADSMRTRGDVEEVLFHEVAHFGMRALFGDMLKPMLADVLLGQRAQVVAKAKAYGLNMNKQADRLMAAEEVLAELAQTRPEMGVIRRLVAAIRSWLRDNIPAFAKMKMTDDELIARFILPARGFVERGQSPRPTFTIMGDEGPETVFSLGEDGAVTDAVDEDRVQFSLAGQTNRQYTAEQKRAMRNVGFDTDEPSLRDRARALWQDAGKKMAQGIVDQFAPVKDMDRDAYALLRLSKGASGAFEAFLRGGKLKLTDGVYDFDQTNPGGVVEKLLIPLQGEHHDFFRWIAANRAERLKTEGREHLFSDQDIRALKTLASGTTSFDYTIQTGPQAGTVTRDRTKVYADSQRLFNEFNKNVLDLAEQSGLIDGASRHLWEHEFYVPFYRVADDSDGGVRGMNIKGGMVRQQAFKQLKGGKEALNADLLDNTLMNWAHLLDAAAKNRAAKATLEAAERMGVAINAPQSTAQQIGTATGNKNGIVWFMDGGQKRFFVVDDPYILEAITALEYAGMRNPVMNAMGAFKHALTVGVTASPYFKIRNLIRDSVQVIATGPISFNPAKNIAQGFALTKQGTDEYFRLLAGGGTIHFGTMLEGSEAKRVQALVESGVDDATILNSDNKVKAFYRQFIEPAITAYNELGNRGEAINRAALYDQLRRQGISHREASLQARDLMDFSMQGSFTTIRFLTQVVPFMNARLQGLYKLGRGAKQDPQRFAVVLGAAALMSLSLWAAYSDDDDWKKREEWDRNNYWWFKFGGVAFRIPKPFEIGAIATVAERGAELFFDKEMTGKRFRQQMLQLLGDNLSMNPVPQLIKPILDVYSNRDSFSGRPIETMGMERLKPEYRFTDRTSMTARALSTGMNAVTGAAGVDSLSPVQIDHMIRGYFGWLGSFVVGSADVIARPATGQSKHPTPDYWKVATGGMIASTEDAPSRYVSQMYEQAKEIEQAYGTWRALQKQGKTAEAKEFFQENKATIVKQGRVADVKRAESQLNERIRIIERSTMDPDVKRERIRKLQQQKDKIARRVQ